MKTPSSRSRSATTVVLGLVGAGLLASGCRTNTNPALDHWNIASVKARAAKSFLGYRADLDGSYRDFHVRQRQDINLTLRRHFLNNNPENPFQTPDPVYDASGRPPLSLLPNPLNYFHIEAIAIGFLTLGLWDVFLPIPIFSIVANFQEGGGEEFMQGLGEPFRTGSFGGQLERKPPKVKEFRVRRP